MVSQLQKKFKFSGKVPCFHRLKSRSHIFYQPGLAIFVLVVVVVVAAAAGAAAVVVVAVIAISC